MSQITAYKCDKCQKPIGDKKHFSLHFGQHSGVAVPPFFSARRNNAWSFGKDISGQFLHFCTPKCLSEYFEQLIASVK